MMFRLPWSVFKHCAASWRCSFWVSNADYLAKLQSPAVALTLPDAIGTGVDRGPLRSAASGDVPEKPPAAEAEMISASSPISSNNCRRAFGILALYFGATEIRVSLEDFRSIAMITDDSGDLTAQELGFRDVWKRCDQTELLPRLAGCRRPIWHQANPVPSHSTSPHVARKWGLPHNLWFTRR